MKIAPLPADHMARVQAISEMAKMLFASEHPGVSGAALAELMSVWLCAHVAVPRDAERERELRIKLWNDWCEVVWNLVDEEQGTTVQ